MLDALASTSHYRFHNSMQSYILYNIACLFGGLEYLEGWVFAF